VNLPTLLRVLAGRRRLRGHEHWPRERLLQYQARRLAELRAHAIAKSPFYRRLHACPCGRSFALLAPCIRNRGP